MRKVAIVLLLVAGSISTAQARSQANKAQPERVRLADVERSVQTLSVVRLTPAFDKDFKDAVGLIKRLHAEGSGTDRVDAEDLAMTALRFYMDHNHIAPSGDDEERLATTKKLAADTGLLGVLRF